MRLSDEMMLGATLERHISGKGPIKEGDGGCALQLACLARGESKQLWSSYHAHPWALEPRWEHCPVSPNCGYVPTGELATAMAMIYHFNDFHKWTIEKIADWVRSVEPTEPEAESPVTREVEVVRD